MKQKKKIIFSLIILSFVLSMSFVSAQDINETSDELCSENEIDVGSGSFSNINEVLTNNVYIRLNGDITHANAENTIDIPYVNVTIDGNGHTIDAKDYCRIFNVGSGNSLTIKNLKLINGNAVPYAGGAIENRGSITIIDCTFDNNHALQGGAIANYFSNMLITGTVFSNNYVTKDAGAIYNYDSSLTMSGKNTFINNKATEDIEGKGGAILNVFGSVANCTGETIFNNNLAIYDAGAIFNHQAIFYMNGINTFTNNKLSGSEGKGGAINNENATFYLSGTNTFTSNSAIRGGAIDNSLSESVFVLSGKNEFKNNHARMGGAISDHDSTRFDLLGENTFDTNMADDIGGVIYSYNGAFNIDSKNTFNKNTATNVGGAIYSASTRLNMKGTNVFTSNSAREGGAIIITGNTRVDITGENTFSSNYASSAGGAIQGRDANIVLGNHNYFINNEAAHSGGAIYMLNSVLDCQGSLFQSNRAQFGGGIYLQQSAFAGSYNIFKDNYYTNTASGAGPDILSADSSINRLEYNYWNSQNKVTQDRIRGYDISNIRTWTVIDFTIPSEIKTDTETELVRFRTNSFTDLTGGEMPKYTVSATPNFNPSNVVITKNVGKSKYTGGLGQVTVNVASSNFGGSKTVNVVEGAKQTSLSGNNIVLRDPSQTANYEVTLTSADGKKLSGKTITITVDNTKYARTTNNQGVASLSLSNLNNGYHEIVSSFAGEDKLFKSTTTNGILCLFTNESNTQISANNVEMYYKDGSRYKVKLTDSSAKPLASKDVKFYISGGLYTRTTDNNGEASIAINLNSGKYNVIACYPGDDKHDFAYVENTITVNPTISGKDIVKYYKNGTQYYAKFLNGNGQPLKNKDISYNINGVFYTRKTDENGYARLNINLNPGTYIITAINPVNGEMYSNTVKVLSVLKGKDLTKYYRNASQYDLLVLDGNGKPVGAGEKVKLNINGVFYERTTNASGIARLSINLNPGDYIITAEYNGLSASNKIKVLPILFAHDITMSYKDGTKFEVKLVDGQGKAFANQNVTLNINGVFYTRGTDDSGIARLAINLMPGEYIITSSYGSAMLSNKITIH